MEKEDTKTIVSSRRHRTDAPVNSKRSWQHAHDLNKSKWDGASVLRGENGHDYQFLSQKLSPIGTAFKEKIFVFSGISLRIQTTLNEGPKSSNR